MDLNDSTPLNISIYGAEWSLCPPNFQFWPSPWEFCLCVWKPLLLGQIFPLYHNFSFFFFTVMWYYYLVYLELTTPLDWCSGAHILSADFYNETSLKFIPYLFPVNSPPWVRDDIYYALLWYNWLLQIVHSSDGAIFFLASYSWIVFLDCLMFFS